MLVDKRSLHAVGVFAEGVITYMTIRLSSRIKTHSLANPSTHVDTCCTCVMHIE